MLEAIKDRVTGISKTAGVEISLLQDNTYRIVLLILMLEKKQVKVVKKQLWESASLEVLKGQIEKDIPVNLVVNGKGILHKKIADAGNDDKSIVQSVLPNAKANDFYVQNFITGKNNLVSIVRKDQIVAILNSFKNLNIHCTSLTLGGLTVGSVLPIIEKESDTNGFEWAGHQLELDRSGDIVDYKTPGVNTFSTSFQLGTERLEEEYLIAFSAGFGFLIKNEVVSPFVEEVIISKEEFLNGQLFTKLSWAVLGFFLVVLMVNFILFTKYSSRNIELAQKESKYASMLAEMERLDKEVKEKESFLSEAGWLQSSYATYYGDRIAATVPGSVKLTELSINSADERKSKEEKKEVFATGTILIKGDCTRPTELNEWLDKIKSIDRIAKAKLLHYTFDNKENKGSFSIEIITN